jgi:hypothetical protein
MLRFLKKLHDAGVTIVAGTDDLAGFTCIGSSSTTSPQGFRRHARSSSRRSSRRA